MQLEVQEREGGWHVGMGGRERERKLVVGEVGIGEVPAA